MPNEIALHGVMLDIHGVGVLITGKSQIGKSELALNLVQRRHRLIADDYVILQKNRRRLVASCPTALQGFLAIRDLGIISVVQLFGQQAICRKKELELIIRLVPWHKSSVKKDAAPLQGTIDMQTLLDINIPQQTLRVAPYRCLVTLVETAAQQQKYKRKGYDAYADFMSKQTLPFNDKS